MLPLDQLLATFSQKHITEFKKWVATMGHSQQDLKLFTYLVEKSQGRNSLTPDKALKGLSSEAYSSARRRLHKKIIDFLVKVESEEDHTPVTDVMRYLHMVMRCMRFNQRKAAIYYLDYAVKMATAAKQLGLLDQILYLRVKNAELLQIDVEEAIKEWERNSEHLHRFRQIEIAFTEIRSQLHRAKKAGAILQVESIIHDVFNKFSITKHEANDPELMMRLIGIGRAAYISTKQYSKIEHFVERFYNRFKKANAFGPGMTNCELDYLYILAHTYYRNCKFSHALKYIKLIDQHLSAHPGLVHNYAPRIDSLKAGIMAFTNRNSQAIDHLKRAVRSRPVMEDHSERANMQLNLAVYYFNDSCYKEANQLLRALLKVHNLQELKGREWMMKKEMIHAIVYYELDQQTRAITQVTQILKTYSDCWVLPMYEISHHFLLFAQRIFMDPQIVYDKEFRKELNAVRLSASTQQADLQVMAFYSWLKSRVFGGNYYELLLQRATR